MAKCVYIPPTEFARVGYTPGEHAQSQATVPRNDTAWLDWDGYYAREEAAQEAGRFTPFDSALPADLYSVVDGAVRRADGSRLPPYPWIGDRAERIRIARQAIAEGLQGIEVDKAVDLTMFARAFERWAEEVFPTGKG